MLVKELIEKLQKMDQDLEVVAIPYDVDWFKINEVSCSTGTGKGLYEIKNSKNYVWIE